MEHDMHHHTTYDSPPLGGYIRRDGTEHGPDMSDSIHNYGANDTEQTNLQEIIAMIIVAIGAICILVAGSAI